MDNENCAAFWLGVEGKTHDAGYAESPVTCAEPVGLLKQDRIKLVSLLIPNFYGIPIDDILDMARKIEAYALGG